VHGTKDATESLAELKFIFIAIHLTKCRSFNTEREEKNDMLGTA
jgi:hypothetical protein